MTQPNPIEAEALGLPYVTATYGGREWSILADVDTWPLDAIRSCVGMTKTDRVAVNYPQLLFALQLLLGEQWTRFAAAAPKRKHLVPASHAFAAAVGIGGGDGETLAGDRIDAAFGGIPRLLRLLDLWPGKVESDLDRFWNIDYANRFRFTKQGRRKLTLRQIYTRLETLPVDSALAIAMNDGHLHKTGTELVLMDIYEARFGVPHPSRPLTAQQRAERDAERKAKADYKARQAKRSKSRESTAMDLARSNAQAHK